MVVLCMILWYCKCFHHWHIFPSGQMSPTSLIFQPCSFLLRSKSDYRIKMSCECHFMSTLSLYFYILYIELWVMWKDLSLHIIILEHIVFYRLTYSHDWHRICSFYLMLVVGYCLGVGILHLLGNYRNVAMLQSLFFFFFYQSCWCKSCFNLM